jgi:hypothetical protein
MGPMKIIKMRIIRNILKNTVLVLKFMRNPMKTPKWSLDEVVLLPCKECGEKLPVNVVYVPFLDGYSSCMPYRCPKKMTEMSEA